MRNTRMFYESDITRFDPELSEAIAAEKVRQEQHIELIASENYVSRAVLEAQGSVLTNKYAEGYPKNRYYGGCAEVDRVEQLAIDRACKLFKADYANVQPHSGSQANAAVFMALAKPGDTLLGLGLSDGGHLTHGSKVSFSGKFYHSVAYGVDPQTGLIDYAQIEALAEAHRPRVLIAGFSAYSRFVDWSKFRDIANRTGAYLMVDMAHIAGLVATGLYPSPIPFADVVTSTTHKTLRGPRGGLILARSNPDLEKRLNSAIFPGMQGGPLMHVIAAKAVAFREALDPGFQAYQRQVIQNADVMAQTIKKRGFPIVSGGTDNHLLLLDLSHQDMTGQEVARVLEEANITVNKNAIPNDKRSPFITSGIRLGTPAMTTRGFKEKEASQIAHWISDILENPKDSDLINRIKRDVIALCLRFPVYMQS